MGLFDKLREPIVLKDESDARKQIQQLSEYLPHVQGELKEKIEQDIQLLQYGIKGEEAIMFELKNSHMPMYILHDLFFTQNDLTAQIDYIIVTRKLTIIIECKNLYGNITIDHQGNFIRTIQFGKYFRKEGIYSPVTQNQRHLDMIHEIRGETKSVLSRSLFDHFFNENYKSVVVLSNPKSVLDMRYAPKEIKEKVIKADGLINHIKVLHQNSNNDNMSDKQMLELAEFFLEHSTHNTKDYTAKYRQPILETTQKSIQNVSSDITSEHIEDTAIYQALKAYRLQKSREENIKPYFIYNNAQLEDIIQSDPKTLDELKKIKGFGDLKCDKYGMDILRILTENKIHHSY